MYSVQLSSSDYRIVVEQAPIMVWRANTEALCDYFNERWLQFTGRSLDQEIGNGWAAGVHPDDLAQCLDTYRNAFALREAFEMEYRLRRYDGEYRWILDRGGPVNDADGNFVGYIGSCIDVTDRINAQAALAHAHHVGLTVLSALLPMCAWCRKIQNDDGAWVPIEAYLNQHTDAKVTHGICPDCQQDERQGW